MRSPAIYKAQPDIRDDDNKEDNDVCDADGVVVPGVFSPCLFTLANARHH